MDTGLITTASTTDDQVKLALIHYFQQRVCIGNLDFQRSSRTRVLKSFQDGRQPCARRVIGCANPQMKHAAASFHHSTSLLAQTQDRLCLAKKRLPLRGQYNSAGTKLENDSPVCSSSCRIWALTADWVRFNCCPAVVKLDRLAAVLKVRSSAISNIDSPQIITNSMMNKFFS